MLKEIGVLGALPEWLLWVPVALAIAARYPRWRTDFARANADAAEHKLRKEVAELARGVLLKMKGADKRA